MKIVTAWDPRTDGVVYRAVTDERAITVTGYGVCIYSLEDFAQMLYDRNVLLTVAVSTTTATIALPLADSSTR